VATYTSEAPPTPADAQRVVDSHAVSIDGRCVCCGGHGGCWLRVTALHVLATADRLPRRRRGASRPELIGARRVR
jgi:hypothetical protein